MNCAKRQIQKKWPVFVVFNVLYGFLAEYIGKIPGLIFRNLEIIPYSSLWIVRHIIKVVVVMCPMTEKAKKLMKATVQWVVLVSVKAAMPLAEYPVFISFLFQKVGNRNFICRKAGS